MGEGCKRFDSRILWWQRLWGRFGRRSIRRREPVRKATLDISVRLFSCQFNMTYDIYVTIGSKRLEHSPSHPSFGIQSQERGKVLYNEVMSSRLTVTNSDLFAAGYFCRL